MSINKLATVEYVDKKHKNLDEQITYHHKRYSPTQFVLTDVENGLDYVFEMRSGLLKYYSKCHHIQVTKLPDKTSGNFDPTGLVISAVGQDGSLREITNYTLSQVIDGVVTVTYNEAGIDYTTTFETSCYNIENALIDFEYVAKEDGTYDLTGWKQTLNGEPSTECVIPDLEKGLLTVEVV